MRFVAVSLGFVGCLLCVCSFVVGRLGVGLFVVFLAARLVFFLLAAVLGIGLRVLLVAAFGTGGFGLLSVVLLATDTSAHTDEFGLARNL